MAAKHLLGPDMGELDWITVAGTGGPGLGSLEKENFRIDSSDWKAKTLEDGTRVRINPEGDIMELLD